MSVTATHSQFSARGATYSISAAVLCAERVGQTRRLWTMDEADR